MEPQRLADIMHAALDRALDAGPDISDLKSLSFNFTEAGITVRVEPEGAAATDHTVTAADLADALDEDVEPAPAAPQTPVSSATATPPAPPAPATPTPPAAPQTPAA